AKGLEFDTVILPALDGLTRSSERELLLWHEHLDADNHGHPLLGLLPARGAADDPLYDYLQFEHKQRDALEATRLLYIAVTRAARSAWLFGYVSAADTGYTCAANSLLHCILPALQEAPERLGVSFVAPSLPPSPPHVEASPKLATQPLLRLAADWTPPALPALLPTVPAALPMEPTHTQPLARTIGDLVHLALKHLAQRRALPPLATAPWWRQQLAPLCADDASLQTALDTVRAQLDACLQDPALAWLFAGDLREDACELALVDYGSGERRDYVVDRTFIDREGARWIIDYKSAQPNAGQPMEDFVAGQCAAYQEQLRLYARLLRQDAQPLRCALLLTALPALVELPS
ncbi:MAG TPA: PD-(D/E)XK nuclease family protein, partial [Hyphomicrobiales bacterium]|nr:PD-(D/E)XK nuclease family protein [Hyphomicrobiales bacterium]